jgi:hypothetical protein
MRRIALVCLLFSLLGCAPKPPNIVGTWVSGLGGALTTYHFRPDGTFSLETLFDGYKADVSGKYHFENRMFYMDPEAVDVQGAGPRLEEIKASLNQSSRLYYEIHSPASIRLGAQEPPLMLSKTNPNP